VSKHARHLDVLQQVSGEKLLYNQTNYSAQKMHYQGMKRNGGTARHGAPHLQPQHFRASGRLLVFFGDTGI
jgi:hypothetical protein